MIKRENVIRGYSRGDYRKAELPNVMGTGRDGTRSWTSRAETKLNYEFKIVIRKLFFFLFFF